MKFRPSREFMLYIVTGGSAALVDLGVFLLLGKFGLSVLPATLGSYMVAALWNHQLASRVVFRVPPTFKNFVAFVVAQSVGIATNTLITWGGAELGYDKALAKIAGIAVAFLINFTLAKKLVFKTPRA